MHIEFQGMANFSDALLLMLLGMVGIFVVMVLLLGVIVLLNKTTEEKGRRLPSRQEIETSATWIQRDAPPAKGSQTMADNKKMVEAITSMDEDFAQWYTDVVKKPSSPTIPACGAA